MDNTRVVYLDLCLSFLLRLFKRLKLKNISHCALRLKEEIPHSLLSPLFPHSGFLLRITLNVVEKRKILGRSRFGCRILVFERSHHVSQFYMQSWTSKVNWIIKDVKHFGRYARRRWFLSAGQKKRVRTRLREVDELIETLKASNITTPKLVLLTMILSLNIIHRRKPLS